LASSETNSYGECHGAVRDSLLEGSVTRELGIDMKGKVISTVASMNHNVGFGNGPA
jgi:hypothetical protein